MAQPNVPGISPEELKRRLDSGEQLQVIDVREPSEFAQANIGAKLIPMDQLPQRLNEIDRTRPAVVHCKAGGRSARAVEFLQQQGYTNTLNLDGGIQAWVQKIDPTLKVE